MLNPADSSHWYGPPVLSAVRRCIALLVFAVSLCSLSFLNFFPQYLNAAFLVVGVSLVLTAIGVKGRALFARKTQGRVRAALAAMIEADAHPNLIADLRGVIFVSNSAAQNRLKAFPGAGLEKCLRSLLPIPASVLVRLQSRLEHLDCNPGSSIKAVPMMRLSFEVGKSPFRPRDWTTVLFTGVFKPVRMINGMLHHFRLRPLGNAGQFKTPILPRQSFWVRILGCFRPNFPGMVAPDR